MQIVFPALFRITHTTQTFFHVFPFRCLNFLSCFGFSSLDDGNRQQKKGAKLLSKNKKKLPPQALTYEEFYDNGPKAAEDDPVDDDDDARGGGAGRPFYVVYSEKIIRITTETDDSKNEPKK